MISYHDVLRRVKEPAGGQKKKLEPPQENSYLYYWTYGSIM